MAKISKINVVVILAFCIALASCEKKSATPQQSLIPIQNQTPSISFVLSGKKMYYIPDVDTTYNNILQIGGLPKNTDSLFLYYPGFLIELNFTGKGTYTLSNPSSGNSLWLIWSPAPYWSGDTTFPGNEGILTVTDYVTTAGPPGTTHHISGTFSVSHRAISLEFPYTITSGVLTNITW